MAIIKRNIGWILTLGGVIAIIFGVTRYNSAESQLIRAFGGSDGSLTMAFIIGIVLSVIGIALLVTSSNAGGVTQLNSSVVTRNQEIIKVRCPSCQTLNNDKTKFCVNCGKQLISDNDQV